MGSFQKVRYAGKITTKTKVTTGKKWCIMLFLQKTDCAKNNKDRVKNNKKFIAGSDTMYMYIGIAVAKSLNTYISGGRDMGKSMKENR